MNNISGSIESILEDLGYKLTPDNNGWRSNRLYANGDNETALKIYPDGGWTDFVESKSGRFEELVALSLGNKTIDEAKEWLSNKDFEFKPQNQLEEPLITTQKYKNKEFLNKLDKSDKSQEYWINRGISLNVLKQLGGGIYKNKYYFPIWDKEDKNLLGWSARILDKNSNKKYIIAGEKKNFLYFNKTLGEIERVKRVFIHEGIADLATLMTLGISNNLVQFGTDLSFTIVNHLLRISDIEIVICQNNDKAGAESGPKVERKLLKYFDKNQVKRIIPPVKDINQFFLDKGEKEVLDWICQF